MSQLQVLGISKLFVYTVSQSPLRQIHPVDQISPVPYARRSLDRRTRTIPPGKSNSPINTGYDRRTESFCLSPTKDQQLQQKQMTAVAYPTTPNICVTGGKIEFITPPGSTISSNASGNCSTLFSSPSLSSSPSPKDDSPSHRSRSTLPVNVTQKHSPSRRNSSRRRKSPKVSSPIICNSFEKPERPSQGSSSPSTPAYHENDSIISESAKDVTNELDTLRQENKHMKEELSTLQEEYSKLQEYVRELEGTLSSKKDLSSEEMDGNEPSQFQVAIKLLEKILVEGEMRKLNRPNNRLKVNLRKAQCILVERCNTLEQVNAQLQAESLLQRQQYEKCLDKVASKVVQAILVQKTQQEQCERLTKKVEDLQQQNMTLSSIIVSKGKYQSLNHCRKAHLLPVSLISNSNSNSLSLPNTLIKTKTHCDTDNSSSTNKAADCWYNNNNINNNKEKATCPSYKSLRVRLEKCNRLLPRNCSSSLPQSGSSKKTSLHHQSSADGCWYDIIKSLQNGDASHTNIQNGVTDNNNTSSDNSSVDTEKNLDSQNRMLRSTEDDVITSSQYLNSKTLSSHKGRTQDINLDFVPSQSSYNNTVVANFTVNSSPKLDNKVPTFSCNNNKSIDNLSNSSKTTNKIDNGHSPEDQKAINEPEGKSTEGTVKDEGYSTMSSDVQSEAKDSVAVVTISTVVEERGRSFDGESESKEESPTETLKTSSVSFETLKLENNNNNNKKNLNVGVVSLSVKDADQSQPEYSDGLRVVYDDEEDNNSDILYIPIAEENDRYLMRHSFNFPFPNEPIELQRCSSDSYLYKLFVRFPNCSNIASKRLSTNHNALQSLPLKKQNHSNIYNTYLRRAFRKESLKREVFEVV
ncbi:Nck-associated protein 5 [Armadillidium vulgare]|nr:Nck-associated protein 5 [Armadillidium vulgare]